jgi:peptidoglycan hydrolase-like protein with peptidoglycan-binding domain
MSKLLVLQRGHYPRRTGSTGTSGLDADPTEQEFAVKACRHIAAAVQAAGWQVRTINADVPLSVYGGDAFVAIHCDGSVHQAAKGASVGYRTAQGASLGAAFKHAYYAEGWRGFRPDNYTPALAGYYGTGKAVAMGNRRAIIIESGFLTNPHDEAILQARGHAMLADAVVVALTGAPVAPRPPAPPVVGGGATLRVGSVGEQVRQWQSILAGAGLLGQGEIDGRFGPRTEAATKAFQAQLGVEPDGVVGPDTRAATARLFAWLSAQRGHVSVEPGYPGPVELGDTGWAVKVWQRQLVRRGYRLAIDGVFGPATLRAVTHWQRAHHPTLEVDGVAGPATWHSLLRA